MLYSTKTNLFPRRPFRRVFQWWLLTLATQWLSIGYSQAPARIELGYPGFVIHSTTDIGAQRGSRFVCLDTNGRILFSSDGQLFAFDGTNWKRASSPGNRPQENFVTLKPGPDGEIYVGGFAFWGKLVVDRRGRYMLETFASDEEQRNASIESFNRISFVGDDVYFASLNQLVRWNPTTGSESWNIPSIEEIFNLNGELYVQQLNVGLHRLQGNQLEFVEGSELLTREQSRTVRACDWFDGRKALFNNKRGLILFDGHRFEDIPDDIASADQRSWANDMVKLNEETVAVTLVDQGVVFLDRKGRITTRLDQSLDHRLIDCGDITVADDGSLWIAVSDGVAQVLYPSPITFFDRSLEFPLSYPEVQRFNGELLLCNSAKLFKGVYNSFGRLISFAPFERLGEQEFHRIEPIDEGLLVGTSAGLFLMENDGEVKRFLEGVPIRRIHAHTHAPNTYTVSNGENAYVLKRHDDMLTVVATLPIGGPANRILDDSHGDVWMERGISRIGRITHSGNTYRYSEYGVKDGLTSDQWVPIWKFEDEVRFSSRKGVLRFDREKEHFTVATQIDRIIPSHVKRLSRIAADEAGNLWVAAADGNLVLRKQEDGTYVEDRATLQALDNFPIDRFTFDQNGITWLASQKALARVDTRQNPIAVEIPKPRITQINDSATGDLLYHFSGSKGDFPKHLSYSQNGLAFEWATPYYQSTRGIRHRYRVSGYTETWSNPQQLSEIAFHHLPSGDYRLQIQAVSEAGGISPSASVAFSIAPPIYGTALAYSVYAALLVGLCYSVIRIRHHKLVGRQKDLEAKVAEQTRELREKNIQLHGAYLSERDLKKRAEHANKAKGEFLAMVSHEIRTPMNCIIGMTDNLLDTPLEAEQYDMLTTIHSSGQSLVAIISDILDYSKIEAGKITLEEVPLSPAACVSEAVKLFEAACEKKGLKLNFNIAPDIPALVVGDPIRLKQTFINLISNAQKFTESGAINVSLSHSENQQSRILLHFSVQDTGIGIDSSKMDLLFKSFSQIDSSNTRKYGGTGLGLAICKRLVSLMGGDIGVSSQPGHGSTFSLTVTTRAPTEGEKALYERSERRGIQASVPRVSQQPSISTRGAARVSEVEKDVLVVEDNPINQEVTAMMLRRIGYSYDVVDNGKRACEVVASKKYKIILMDIQMPEMDGLQCARLIRNENGNEAPPILAVTAKSSDFDRDLAMKVGMVGFLTKPFERAKLKEAIQTALEQHQPKLLS